MDSSALRAWAASWAGVVSPLRRRAPSSPTVSQLMSSSFLDGPHLEVVATALGRVGERRLDGQALPPHVLAPGVDQATDLGGLGNVGGVDLLQPVDVAEDGVELLPIALDLLITQAEAGEHGDVGDLVAGEGHRFLRGVTVRDYPHRARWGRPAGPPSPARRR